MRVFDFFSGGGCFSTTASELEGVEAALGVDNWSVALSTYRRNPHGGRKLPEKWAALRLPLEQGGEAVHAHFRFGHYRRNTARPSWQGVPAVWRYVRCLTPMLDRVIP